MKYNAFAGNESQNGGSISISILAPVSFHKPSLFVAFIQKQYFP